MFRIWRDRKVYDKAFVKQLDLLLSGESSDKGELVEWECVKCVSVFVPTESGKETEFEATPPPEVLPDFKVPPLPPLLALPQIMYLCVCVDVITGRCSAGVEEVPGRDESERGKCEQFANGDLGCLQPRATERCVLTLM